MTLDQALALLGMLTAGPRFAKYLPSAVGDGCWQWTGNVGKRGYGQFQAESKRSVYAHRFMYEAVVGPIPEGMVLDHTCHNDTPCPGGWTCPHRSCVNPAHLEAVTQSENQKRSGGGFRASRLKTHCVRGHELAGGNLLVRPTGHRQCRECTRIHKANWRERQRRAA